MVQYGVGIVETMLAGSFCMACENLGQFSKKVGFMGKQVLLCQTS